jgi:hypothetical protein
LTEDEPLFALEAFTEEWIAKSEPAAKHTKFLTAPAERKPFDKTVRRF